MQNLIDIIRKGRNPLIPLISADAEDQHEEQRKPCGCQPGEYVNDNTLTVYIKRLREKIEDDPTDPKIILTVRGTGYKVDA